jgi:hypothetical protein
MMEHGRYHAMPDRLTMGSKVSVTDLGCKDLKEVDGVGDVVQHGI